jgi:hypothetical protein
MRRAAALLVLALPLVACGGGGGGAVAGASLADAATNSSSKSTVKIDMQLTMRPPQLGQPLTMSIAGAMDNAHKRGDFKLDMSQLADIAGGNAGSPSEWKGEEVVDAANGNLVVYMRLPFFARVIPGGKPWVKLDVTAAGRKLGVDFSQLTQLTGNPAEMLGWLRATSGKVTKVGEERVGGEETTHYRATIDLQKYPDVVPADQRAAARRAVQALIRLTHVRTYPVDAWVAKDGLIRKMALRFAESIQGQRLTLGMIMWFHDFGAPVTVTIPPADETTDLSTLTGGQS